MRVAERKSGFRVWKLNTDKVERKQKDVECLDTNRKESVEGSVHSTGVPRP